MQIGKHLRTVFLALTICALLGCENEARRGGEDKISAETESSNVRAAISVDVETASLSDVSLSREYKGITQPQKEVAWRSQTEGILLELSADLGDGVEQGQVIGKLDDSLLVSDLAGRMAELSVLESELAQANIQVKNAQIRLDEAQIQLEQAESEAKRYQNLAATGIIPEQQAESFKTTAKIAGKTVLTAQESIKLEQKAVAIIEGRIATQRSAISESQQRQTYSQIRVPIDGTVIAKQRDPGSLVRVGEEIITVGDLSKIKLIVPISELDLGEVRIGQEVRVSLDAFQNQKFAGRVSRISPTTNLQSRQIPIEILLDNPDRKIKAGLLGRVSFFAERESNVVVPKTAIVNQAGTNYIFVTTNKNKDNQSNVSKRKVIIKNSSSEEKVEIIAGLLPGERYVIRSSKPLQDKDVVSLSIISQ